jgi:hypothetical protein
MHCFIACLFAVMAAFRRRWSPPQTIKTRTKLIVRRQGISLFLQISLQGRF